MSKAVRIDYGILVWYVRMIFPGDCYGLRLCLRNETDAPVIDAFDATEMAAIPQNKSSQEVVIRELDTSEERSFFFSGGFCTFRMHAQEFTSIPDLDGLPYFHVNQKNLPKEILQTMQRWASESICQEAIHAEQTV